MINNPHFSTQKHSYGDDVQTDKSLHIILLLHSTHYNTDNHVSLESKLPHDQGLALCFFIINKAPAVVATLPVSESQ